MKLLKLVPDDTNIKFLKWRVPFYIVSVMLMILSWVAVFTMGLNYGVDFAGGQEVQLTFEQRDEAPIPQLRELVGGLGYGEPVVQEFGQPNQVSIRVPLPEGTEDTPGAATAIGDRVIAAISAEYPGVRKDGNDTVSGKVAGEFRTAALYALLAAMAASLTWKIVEVIEKRKPSLIGVLSGLIAGLVAITPAAGFVDPMGAVIIGLIAGPVCYAASVWIKKLLRYDDSLDAFGIHGAGGVAGAILTGMFASAAVNAAGADASVMKQLWGLGVTAGWSAGVTFLILIVCKLTTGLRVSESQEDDGLDGHLHGEVLEAS